MGHRPHDQEQHCTRGTATLETHPSCGRDPNEDDLALWAVYCTPRKALGTDDQLALRAPSGSAFWRGHFPLAVVFLVPPAWRVAPRRQPPSDPLLFEQKKNRTYTASAENHVTTFSHVLEIVCGTVTALHDVLRLAYPGLCKARAPLKRNGPGMVQPTTPGPRRLPSLSPSRSYSNYLPFWSAVRPSLIFCCEVFSPAPGFWPPLTGVLLPCGLAPVPLDASLSKANA